MSNIAMLTIPTKESKLRDLRDFSGPAHHDRTVTRDVVRLDFLSSLFRLFQIYQVLNIP